VCAIVCYPLMKNYFFFYFTGGLRGVEKGGRQIQFWHFADVAGN